MSMCCLLFFFFFNDTATTEIYTLSLHDALPICISKPRWKSALLVTVCTRTNPRSEEHTSELQSLTNLVCRLLLEKKKKTLVAVPTWTEVASVARNCLLVVPSGSSDQHGSHLPLDTDTRFVTALVVFFFFNDTATTEIYPLSLPDALPISLNPPNRRMRTRMSGGVGGEEP